MSPRHTDDELRARLARLDPAGAVPVEPASGSRAAEQMERAMQTVEPPPSTTGTRRLTPRRLAFAGGATLAAAAAATAGVLVWGGGDPPASDSPTTLDLSLSEQAATASCIEFSEDVLADMPVAFAGTVSAVADDEVVLDVDRWFTGGDADRVRLDVPGGISPEAAALWYGVDFQKGERYLVTATNGNVNSCGYTSAATPEMEASFERAFSG